MDVFVFDGNHKRTNRPAQDNPEQFRQRLHELRQQREKERVRSHSALVVQQAWRSCRARLTVHRKLRAKYDATRIEPSADLSGQICRLRMFFSVNEAQDRDRLNALCDALLRRSSKTGVSDKESLLICRLLCLCLKLIQHEADGSPKNWQKTLRVVEVYGLSSPANVRHLVDSGYFESVFGLLARQQYVGAGHLSMDDIRARPASHVVQELWTLLLRPLAHTDDQQLSAHVYSAFVRVCLYQPPSALLHCTVIPALAQAVKDRVVDMESLLTSLLVDDWPSHVYDKPNEPVVQVLRHQQPCASTPYALLNLATEPESWSESVRLQYLLCVSGSVSWLCDQPSEAAGTSAEPMQIDGDDDDDSAPHDQHQMYNSDTPPAHLQPGVGAETSGCLLHNWSALQTAAFGQWHSVRLLHHPAVQSVLCDAALAGDSVAAARFLSPIGALLCSLGAHKQSSLIYRLSFHRDYVEHLWRCLRRYAKTTAFGQPVPLLVLLERAVPLSEADKQLLLPSLCLFCVLMGNTLLPLHDDEFWTQEQDRPTSSLMPFSNEELCAMAGHMRDVALSLVDLAYPDSTSSAAVHGGRAQPDASLAQWNRLFEAVVELLSRLHKLDCRLHFCPADFWGRHTRRVVASRQTFRSVGAHRGRQPLFSFIQWMTHDDVMDNDGYMPSTQDLRSVAILRRMPFVVAFHERVGILHQLIAADKLDFGRDEHGMAHPQSQHTIHIRVRRNHLYEDAHDKLSMINEPCLKKPIRVSMTNWAGLNEAGIDGGGIFREFLNELLKEGFDPARGFFTYTEDNRLLYPNPVSSMLFPDDYKEHYEFLGRMLGKLIYEQQLAELRFASFFLAKLQRSQSDAVDLHQLQSMDPVLYRNLSSLKSEPDVQALALDFSLMIDRMGIVEVVDLKPNGRNIRVTDSNKLEYIHLVADFYLNRQLRPMVAAFRAGLSNVLDIDWLHMFDHNELQTLVSGVDADIDLADMRHHTAYSGGADDNNEFVCRFWRVAHELSGEQKRCLLKFITGCSRPPLMGFKDLYPPLCIQLTTASDRLPSAATCMNLLKLPSYVDDETLRHRLTYAIESGSGFELS